MLQINVSVLDKVSPLQAMFSSVQDLKLLLPVLKQDFERMTKTLLSGTNETQTKKFFEYRFREQFSQLLRIAVKKFKLGVQLY